MAVTPWPTCFPLLLSCSANLLTGCLNSPLANGGRLTSKLGLPDPKALELLLFPDGLPPLPLPLGLEPAKLFGLKAVLEAKLLGRPPLELEEGLPTLNEPLGLPLGELLVDLESPPLLFPTGLPPLCRGLSLAEKALGLEPPFCLGLPLGPALLGLDPPRLVEKPSLAPKLFASFGLNPSLIPALLGLLPPIGLKPELDSKLFGLAAVGLNPPLIFPASLPPLCLGLSLADIPLGMEPSLDPKWFGLVALLGLNLPLDPPPLELRGLNPLLAET